MFDALHIHWLCVIAFAVMCVCARMCLCVFCSERMKHVKPNANDTANVILLAFKAAAVSAYEYMPINDECVEATQFSDISYKINNQF